MKKQQTLKNGSALCAVVFFGMGMVLEAQAQTTSSNDAVAGDGD